MSDPPQQIHQASMFSQCIKSTEFSTKTSKHPVNFQNKTLKKNLKKVSKQVHPSSNPSVGNTDLLSVRGSVYNTYLYNVIVHDCVITAGTPRFRHCSIFQNQAGGCWQTREREANCCDQLVLDLLQQKLQSAETFIQITAKPERSYIRQALQNHFTSSD